MSVASKYTLTAIILIISLSAVGFLLLPVDTRHPLVPSNQCCLRLDEQNNALLLYTDSNDGRYPLKESWMDAVASYDRVKTDPFVCPEIKNRKADQFGYAMNDEVSGIRIDDIENPDSVVAIYDSDDLSWNAHGPYRGVRLSTDRAVHVLTPYSRAFTLKIFLEYHQPQKPVLKKKATARR